MAKIKDNLKYISQEEIIDNFEKNAKVQEIKEEDEQRRDTEDN